METSAKANINVEEVSVVLFTAESYVKFDNYIYLHSYRCKIY